MRHDPKALMVFAAGFGTRMAPLTDHMPKPLLTVGGRTLLDHALGHGTDLGLERIVVNAHYRANMIKAHLADRDVAVSHETPNILDTGGGLIHARPLLEDQIVYSINSDVVWFGPNPLDVLREAWKTTSALGLLLLVPLAAAHNRNTPGDFALDAQGAISRGGPLVYTGAQIIDAAQLDAAGEGAFSLNAYWDHLIARNALAGIRYPGEWCDVGTPDGLRRANTLWAERQP
ncbi:MAG: nucleotidyltransferase family protein [Pseudomonadota bacterium]